MGRLEILVEEPSMAELLHFILPSALPSGWVLNENVFVRKHQGKSDLRKSIPIKLKSFSYWREPVGFLIMQDQDSNDCKQLKREIQDLCSGYQHIPILIRIVCREMEAWYLGNMDAIQEAYPTFNAGAFKKKAKFRNPDICNAKDELKKILPHYQEISSARKIGPYIQSENNVSGSFHQFLAGLQKIIQEIEKTVHTVMSN